jgi:hypothetical protein
LYRANGNGADIKDNISNILSLEEGQQGKCYSSLTLTDLTAAIHNSNSGRLPGLDGITYEFYKKFWNELGSLLLLVANTIIQEEIMPHTMLNGVITLVLQEGNLIILSN